MKYIRGCKAPMNEVLADQTNLDSDATFSAGFFDLARIGKRAQPSAPLDENPNRIVVAPERDESYQ